MRTGEAGFTLLEMLVVLALLAAVTGVAAASFAPARPARMLEATRQAVVGELRRARLAAVGAGATRRVLFDPQARRFGLEGGAGFPVPPEVALRVEGARSRWAAEGPAAIAFEGDGRSSGGRVALSAGAARRTVEVDWLTGLVREDRP